MILDDYYDTCSKVSEKDFREELMGNFVMSTNDHQYYNHVVNKCIPDNGFNFPIKETISTYSVEKGVEELIEKKAQQFVRHKEEILEFVTLLRRLHPDVEYAGQNGKCFIVSKLLRSKFGGEIWYDAPGHITTKIEGVHYDITGEVSPDPSAYPLTDELVLARAEEWDKDWRDKRTYASKLFLGDIGNIV
jgi:hypothetical protein